MVTLMNLLWIDFVNSDWHDPLGKTPDRDELEDHAWLRALLDRWRLPKVDPRSRDTQAALRDLRTLLQAFVRTLVRDGSLRPAELATLNRYLAAHPVTSRLEIQDDAFRLRLTPTARGLDGVLFSVTESFAAFLAEGDPTRLKLCENHDCRWVFYDTTRSRTRRWCADSCGNLIKVREFRRKKKTAKKTRRKRRA